MISFPKPVKQEKVRKPIRKFSKSPLPRAKKRAWDAFSMWVRFSNADWDGFVQCFTCDRAYHYTLIQGGHFIHGHMDFNIYNINPQCVRCNKYLSGNLIEYGERIKARYGMEIYDSLIAGRNRTEDYTLADYLEIEAKYKSKLRDFKTESKLIL